MCTNSPPVTPGGRRRPASTQAAAGMPMSATHTSPAWAGASPRRRPRFMAVSVQVSAGVDGRIECLTGGCVQTARNVDAEDWNPRLVDRTDRARLRLARRAAQSCAKDRIDAQLGLARTPPDQPRILVDDDVDAASTRRQHVSRTTPITRASLPRTITTPRIPRSRDVARRPARRHRCCHTRRQH